MPKVAIIGTRGYPSYYGGFETAVRKLAPYLSEAGWDVVVYGRPQSMKLDDPERDQRVHSVATRGLERKSLSTLTYGFTATRRAVKDGCDVALVMNVANGFWLPLLRAARIPTLVNVDGIEWERAKWGRIAKAVFRSGARSTARWANTLVYDAHEIKRWWGAKFGRDGIYIPYGGDAPAQDSEPPLGLRFRGYVLVVARFVPENTIPEFFEAAASIAKAWPVVIVGSSGYGGELDDSARLLAESTPNITWLGHVADDQLLHRLMQNCGVYFHGHSVGGTNPALVQAMACGTPAVARDTVYNREVLGDAGVFTEPSPRQIADTVSELMQDSNRQSALSLAARSRQQELFTWELVCGRYESALREALNARPV
ncbi:glycosyltransferase involved in cell wall biosynthesis [Microbacterium sp. AG157]|uniref:glycosyltransferase n=1 Tax=Microbacterium sp. AG157 TaxID=2183993 RepID=UPI000E24211D|nr:glycosyltransferase [Microbacterium sp. AG157]REC97325.1 glycosyltransferase involved in cell wall biosynthesis [Microbacterium sp. AG157]